MQAAAEEFAVSYENTYKMPIVIVHTMNVFGDRQGPTKFIPRVVNAVKDGNEVGIPNIGIVSDKPWITAGDNPR